MAFFLRKEGLQYLENRLHLKLEFLTLYILQYIYTFPFKPRGLDITFEAF